MHIKSLLLGSAAALAVVSGAQAADAIVAAEPEAVEYVRVCDAYGTGYFYIPGTETCLKIKGYIRFDVNYWLRRHRYDNNGGEDWNVRTRGQVQFTAKSDTEYGPLTGVIVYQANYPSERPWSASTTASLGGKQNRTAVDDVGYIDSLASALVSSYNWWDTDFSGETDVTNSGTTSFNSIRYQYDSNGFYAGIALEELTSFHNRSTAATTSASTAAVGGKVRRHQGTKCSVVTTSTPKTVQSVQRSSYPTSVRAPWRCCRSGAERPERLLHERRVGHCCSVRLSRQLTSSRITPGVQYTDNIDHGLDGNFDAGNQWRAGVTLDYQDRRQPVDEARPLPTSAATTTTVQQTLTACSGFFRLQRAF